MVPFAFPGAGLHGIEVRRSAPWPASAAARSNRILQLAFAGQAIALAGLAIQPLDVGIPTKEALDAAGTGAQEATHETFGQLDELLAELSAR
jgi:hypothetical protein